MVCSCSVLCWLIIPPWIVKIFVAIHMGRLDYLHGVSRGNRTQRGPHFSITVNFMCDFCA
jgi:hypothetical protein